MDSKLSFITIFVAIIGSVSAQTWNTQPSSCPKYSGLVFQDNAPYKFGIDDTITKYREALGGIDNGNAPGQSSGHRSINWDAGIVPFRMPGDFFKNTVTRGAEFLAVEGKFAVSNPPPTDPSGVQDNRFSSFRNVFQWRFRTFSPERLFTPTKSNEVITVFSIPQSPNGQKALVSGFGAIFTNVVKEGKTVMKFYDEKDCLIFQLPVNKQPKGLSFGGIIVTKKNGKAVRAAIASVKMTLGDGIISQDKPWSGKNFVVLDDLIYGEPWGQ